MNEVTVDAQVEIRSKGARTRQAIVEEAVRQFAAVGQRATSVPAIARAVGLTPSAVYAYFPSKKALFDAAIDLDAEGLIADAVPNFAAGELDLDFARLFARLLDALPDRPLVRRVLAGEEMSGAERLVLLPSEKRLLASMTDALRRLQAEGTVRGDIDAELIATGLEAIVISLLTAILQMGGLVDPEISRGVIAVLDAAIRPPAHA